MTQPLPAPRILTQATALAPLQQLAPLQPLNPLAQQVGFHIAFVADFLTTGAVLFARDFAIPGALLKDIHNGAPVPAAVGRALQTFAQIELEAGRELVGFAAEYVSFQLFLCESGETAHRRGWHASLRPHTGVRDTGGRRIQRIGGRAPDEAVTAT